MGSGASHKMGMQFNCLDNLQKDQLIINWEDVVCPICLDFPHNAILLRCSSYDKGCHPFMCDTNHAHSNCLDRFKSANGLITTGKESSISGDLSIGTIPSNPSNFPACPLCRGEVRGWVVIEEGRACWNSKKRCCEKRECSYAGDFSELQAHAQQAHPHARPSEIDPSRRLDWENFQQSLEIVDVLSTIHSEEPHSVVLGDYVIEYGSESGDEFEDFPGDDGNWWTSCVLYQVFDNFRASRNRRRLSTSEASTNRNRLGYDPSHLSRSSTVPVSVASEYRFDESDDEVVGGTSSGGETSRGSSHRRRYRRRRSRFLDQ